MEIVILVNLQVEAVNIMIINLKKMNLDKIKDQNNQGQTEENKLKGRPTSWKI